MIHSPHRKIIDAVIQKSKQLCPDSLALIGVYGSVATGDTHPKSDLDLLILINDANGYALADAFILDDTGIGYDIYCTTWDSLEEDAACGHAHLSKLLDTQPVYVKDQQALPRLEELKNRARALLNSEERVKNACALLENAKKAYAECCLADSVSQLRAHANGVLYYLLNAVMLFHGQYFKKGVKRTFEEISALPLPFSMEELVMAVIRAETPETIQNSLRVLLKAVQTHFARPKQKAAPGKQLSGTYEEMVSNWRNKMWEAAEKDDLFSSFMNMASLHFMMRGIEEEVAADLPDVMAGFDPRDTQKNAAAFDKALAEYLAIYQKAGLLPKHFTDAEAFLTAYLPQHDQ